MNRISIAFLFSIFLFICQKGYEQQYKTFGEFNKMNQRNKGWFPKVIFNDAINLSNISFLEHRCAFGKFNYENSKLYDSIFINNQKIDFYLFEQRVTSIIKLKPDWFLDLNTFDTTNIELIKQEGFYILNNKKNKTIYFTLSN
jgi:hypothetical protein